MISYFIHFGLSSAKIDANPDPDYHFDKDPDPENDADPYRQQ